MSEHRRQPFLLILVLITLMLVLMVVPAFGANNKNAEPHAGYSQETVHSGPDFSGLYAGFADDQRLILPNAADFDCIQLLQNSQLDPIGSWPTPWTLLEGIVYSSSTEYFSYQHSLLFMDNDAGDPSPTIDAFMQIVSVPTGYMGSTFEYAVKTVNSNDLDTAGFALWTVDENGFIDELITDWQIPDSDGSWSSRYVELGGEGTIAVILYSQTTGSSPDEIVYLDDILYTACTGGAGVLNIEPWYGDTQEFGFPGNPQQWVNILGSVNLLSPGDDLAYSLNGGAEIPLSIGPDGLRLESEGDFNIEIDYADLLSGDNELQIRASNHISETEKKVHINYTPGLTWPQDYDTVWNTSSEIQHTAQAVDGHWRRSGDGVSSLPGYNRLLAIGDESWTDYEVTVPVRVNSLDPAGFSGAGEGPAVGLMMRWLGHSSIAAEQPNADWDRVGAVGWYRWRQDGNEALELRGYNSEGQSSSDKIFELNKTYIIKMSVQSAPGFATYRLKFWPEGDEEPLEWDLTGINTVLSSTTGSLLLVANYVWAEFGQLSVRDLDGLRYQVNTTAIGDGGFEFIPDEADFGYGENVQVFAVPDAGNEFYGWSGDVTGTQNPVSFDIFRDMNLTATFGPPSTTLTLLKDGSGTVIIDPEKSEYSFGELVNLTAVPGEDAQFLEWQGDLNTRLNPAVITMNDDKEVTAVFGPISDATPKSDDFSQCELDESLWTIVNPAGDAELVMTGTAVEFQIPGGTAHNLWGSNSDALRILQPTDDRNFEIEAKFNTLPAEKYQLEGILIQQDDDNWLRFMVYSDGTTLLAETAKNEGGSKSVLLSHVILPGSAASIYLKVNRNGDQWTPSISLDGSSFSDLGSFVHELEVHESGLIAGNDAQTAGTEPAFTSQADYFMNTAVPVENSGPGSITIQKETVPADNNSFRYLGDLGNFSLENGQSKLFNNLCAKKYDIREAIDAEWGLNKVECTTPISLRPNDGVSFLLNAGDNVTCKFINKPLPPTSENVEYVGQIGGVTNTTAVKGSYAYLGEGPRLTVLDISNPELPEAAGQSYTMPGIVEDIVIVGDTLYVVTLEGPLFNRGGLRIFDISDPIQPVETGFIDTPGNAHNLDVSGDFAYIADGSYGLRIIDISNPAAPIDVGYFDTSVLAMGVDIEGLYAYVADATGGLRIIDVSNPTAPFEIGFYDTPEYAREVVKLGDFAYVADGSGGLRIIDVSSPEQPFEIGHFNMQAMALQVAGSYAYVAEGSNGVSIIDVSSPDAPTRPAQISLAGNNLDLALTNDTLTIANNGKGLNIYDVSNKFDPRALGTYETKDKFKSVVVVDQIAYAAAGSSGLRILDLSQADKPVEIGSYDTWSAYDVVVSEQYAYVADGIKGLRVIDVTNPSAPFETGSFNTPGWAFDVAVAGDFAYIADYDGGLRIIDISDPAAPFETGHFITPGIAFGVDIKGDTAFIADGNGVDGLRIIDVSDPYNPVKASYLDTLTSARSVKVFGKYVLVAASGLHIIDVSSPSTPVKEASYNTPGASEDVFAFQNHAYIADWYGGLRIINASEPKSPAEDGFYITPGNAWGVFADKDFAYVADLDGGLIILKFIGKGSISIEKEADVADGTSFAFKGDLGNFSLKSGKTRTFSELDPGEYTITESEVSGWQLDSIECDSKIVNINKNGVTLKLEAGEDIHCTFGNNHLLAAADAGGPYNGEEGADISLDAAESTNQEIIKHYKWDCTNDGIFDAFSSEPTGSSCIYADNGVYTLKLQTVDIFNQISTDTAEVTIINVEPEVDAGDDQTVLVGSEVRFAGSFTDPGTADTHTIKWEFGDGDMKWSTLTPKHTYQSAGKYYVILTITDDDGAQGADIIIVDVVNSAPLLWGVETRPAEINEGGRFYLSGSMSDSNPDSKLILDIDWGDGQTTRKEFAPRSAAFSLSHLCLDDRPGSEQGDTFIINLKLSDDEGAFTTSTATIKVANVPPEVDGGPDREIFTGRPVNFFATVKDPGPLDEHTIMWDFGDGSEPRTGKTVSYSYEDTGEFIITVTATDDDGGIGQDQVKVIVHEATMMPILMTP